MRSFPEKAGQKNIVEAFQRRLARNQSGEAFQRRLTREKLPEEIDETFQERLAGKQVKLHGPQLGTEGADRASSGYRTVFPQPKKNADELNLFCFFVRERQGC